MKWFVLLMLLLPLEAVASEFYVDDYGVEWECEGEYCYSDDERIEDNKLLYRKKTKNKIKYGGDVLAMPKTKETKAAKRKRDPLAF